MTRDLTEGRPLKQIVSFALPLLFGVLFQQLYSFVDTAVVGRFLGPERLAAVGATGSVNFLVIGLCLGLCSGFSIPIAQAFGAKDEREIRRCVWHAAVLSGVLSIVFAILSTALCMSTGQYWMAALYALYTASAVYGYFHWKGNGKIVEA